MNLRRQRLVRVLERIVRVIILLLLVDLLFPILTGLCFLWLFYMLSVIVLFEVTLATLISNGISTLFVYFRILLFLYTHLLRLLIVVLVEYLLLFERHVVFILTVLIF